MEAKVTKKSDRIIELSTSKSQEILPEGVGRHLPGHPWNKELPFPKDFTGEALSLICFSHGVINSFKLVKVVIKKGKVETLHYGEPYGTFEALGRAELSLNKSILKLNGSWKPYNTMEVNDDNF